MDIYKIGVNIALQNNVSQVLAVISRDLLGVNAKANQLQGTFNRVKLAALGAAGVMGGAAALRAMGILVSHGEKLVHQQNMLRQANISSADVARMTANAWKAANDVMGTGVSDNLALLGDLRNILSDIDSASKVLPDMAKVGVVLSAGTGQSPEQAGYAFARFLDLRGALVNPQTEQIDPTQLMREARLGEAIATGTRFRVGPQDLLAFQQQARVAGMRLTDEGLINFAPVIQAMGGSRAGTAINSAQQQLLGGVQLYTNAVHHLESIGILDPKKVIPERGGRYRLLPGALANSDLYQTDMASWVSTVLVPHMRAAGLATTNQQLAYMQATGLRTTVTGLFTELIRNAVAFARDAGNIRQAAGTDPYAVAMGLPQTVSDNRRDRDAYGPPQQQAAPPDPTARMKAFKEAWDNLLTSLGAPLVDKAYQMLGVLTQKLTDLSQWAGAHPDLVRIIGETAAALSGLAIAAGAFAIGAAAATALATLSGPLGLVALAAGITAVAAAVPNLDKAIQNLLPSWLKADTTKGPDGKTTLERLHDQGGADFNPLRDWFHFNQGNNGTPGTGPAFGPQIHHESFVPPPSNGMRPIQIDLYMNENKVGQALTRWQARGASRPPGGQTNFDPRMTPMPTGATVAA